MNVHGMKVYIYQQQKSAMQSGKSQLKNWIVAFDQGGAHHFYEPVMGWPATDDTQSQVHLSFSSQEEALDYCHHHKFEVIALTSKTTPAALRPKSYSDNFTKGFRA